MKQQAASLPRAAPADPLRTFQQAVACHDQGRLREAERLYEIVIKADDRHFVAVLRLGVVRLQQGRFQDAEPLFRRAVKLDKSSADAHHYLAVALTGLGRAEEAVRRYEKALAINPRLAEAHNNFGHVLQLLGRHEQAAAHYEKALAILPAYAEAHNNLGNALQMLGRSEAAIPHYRKAVAARPDYAEAHGNLGKVLGMLGRHEEAIEHYEKALAIRPKHAETHYNLGCALEALGRHEEALTRYEAAVAARPDYAEAHHRLGNALHRLRRSEEAIAHHEQALAIGPNDAEIHNDLGRVLLVLGRLDQAALAFQNAIAAAPRRPGYYLNLANCRRLTAEDPQFHAMSNMAREPSLSVEEQIPLHFALGKALSDQGRYELSFRHLLEGNALVRRHVPYDEAKTLERLDRIRAMFTAKLLQDKQGLGHSSALPVFIVGMPRSGSTLVEQILASHPKVFGAGELPTMGKLVKNIRGPDGILFPDAMAAMSQNELQALAESYLRETVRIAPTAERVTDKQPANFELAGLVHLAFPNARVIHTRRDLRDTAISCFSILFADGRLEYTYQLAELGRYCRAYDRLMEHWRNVLPQGVMLEVRYEEVVENLERQARRIIAHCGLEWHEACLAFYGTERPVRTASATQVRRPIYRSSVDRWRKYEAMLQPLLQALEV